MSETSSSDVVIVGGGLAGLTAASLLVEAGKSVIVLEAADKVGGRIRSLRESGTGKVLADLGPTWVWPPYQPVVAQWLQKLDLKTFEQFDTGNAALDMGPDQPVRFQPLPGQHGIARIAGGPQVLVDALVEQLPDGVLQTSKKVDAITTSSDGVVVAVADETYLAQHVIVAAPLRVAETISFDPALPGELMQVMQAMPTWMSVHAKAVAVYDKPFWRDKGLSGRIASRAGPMVEAHDISGEHGDPATIFGFVGWPHELRKEHASELNDHVLAQLVRCFGQEAANPLHLHVEDWAMNSNICSSHDLAGLMQHPEVGPDISRQVHGRLQFCAAETSDISPGLIEGALASGMRAASSIVSD